jgi:hypothetical protein
VKRRREVAAEVRGMTWGVQSIPVGRKHTEPTSISLKGSLKQQNKYNTGSGRET